jgi:nucleoside-diphosphate-sugar epimerase
MRVLVTGATGFLGSHVTRALVARGLEVTVCIRPGSDPWRLADVLAQLERVTADLADPEASTRALHQARPEAICDLAWEGVGNRFHDDARQVSANLKVHLDLILAAARGGCRRWIGLGTQAEYGPQRARIDESCPPAPTTLYGAVKLSVGLIGQRLAAQTGMEFVWLRLFSSYGPMDDPGWLIPSVTLRLLDGARPELTAGTQKWDYLFVEDAAAALVEAVIAPTLGGPFNLGSGRAVAVRDIVQTIRDRIDPALPLGFGAIAYRPHQIMHLEADITRLCQAIPWRPTTSLADGLARTVDWYRDHRERYAG